MPGLQRFLRRATHQDRMHSTMSSNRDVADCPHRRTDGQAAATCGLLSEWLGDADRHAGHVSDELCVACCREPLPQHDRMNSVVASLWLERRGDPASGISSTAGRSVELNRLALDALPLVAPDFPPLESLIDLTIDADMLAQHVEQRAPFLLLRYGDGEWYSVIGTVGHNCDGHDFLGDSMGRELCSVLEGAAKNSRFRQRVYVGTTRELEYSSRLVLSRIGGAEGIRWATDALFRLGMKNLKTLRFVKACRDFSGRKLLVGSQHLRPVARALNAHHVVIPLRNCYQRLEDIERLCRVQKADLVLSCASMASECLLWRLFQDRPNAMYADCGSIFDVMLGHAIRREYRDWSEVVAAHYAPLFQPFVRSEDG